MDTFLACFMPHKMQRRFWLWCAKRKKAKYLVIDWDGFEADYNPNYIMDDDQLDRIKNIYNGPGSGPMYIAEVVRVG